jgi:uncharacterized protein (TIGR03067 family)
MRIIATWFVCSLLTVTAWAADPQAEMAKLKGKWQVTAVESHGMQLPDELVEGVKLLVLELDTGKLTVRAGDKVVESGTFKIEVKGSRRTIEMTQASAKQNAKTTTGLYEFKGDKLRICVGTDDGKAPKAFTTEGNNGARTITTYERVKE